jgi:hypothetical protein
MSRRGGGGRVGGGPRGTEYSAPHRGGRGGGGGSGGGGGGMPGGKSLFSCFECVLLVALLAAVEIPQHSESLCWIELYNSNEKNRAKQQT